MRVQNAAVLLLNLAVDKVTTRIQSVKITTSYRLEFRSGVPQVMLQSGRDHY
jgi:hypothetical protein